MARIVPYTPDRFAALSAAAERIPQAASLRHRPFVDYYYASSEWCSLHLFLGEGDRVLGTIGVDRLRFQAGSREVVAGFASSFYALEPGAGGYLFLQWMKTCPVGLVFGGSADTHRLLRQQRWAYYPGARVFHLNWPYQPRPGEPRWRRTARRAVLASRRARLPRFASRVPARVRERIAVTEEDGVGEDLLPRRSPFAVRFAPSLDYLRWRYRPGLSFARYRLFRVLDRDASVGYVVIHEKPEELLVAHCDGEDPAALAHGVLLSILEVGREDAEPRAVALAASHPAMRRIYKRFGFRPAAADRPLAFGSLRGPVDLPGDTAQWLVNLGWGDNGLRAPFLDQSPPAPAPPDTDPRP